MKYIVLIGNPFDGWFDGWRVFGPFNSFEEADEWSNTIDEPTWIQSLEKPE